jgi:hypothetical protein
LLADLQPRGELARGEQIISVAIICGGKLVGAPVKVVFLFQS